MYITDIQSTLDIHLNKACLTRWRWMRAKYIQLSLLMRASLSGICQPWVQAFLKLYALYKNHCLWYRLYYKLRIIHWLCIRLWIVRILRKSVV